MATMDSTRQDCQTSFLQAVSITTGSARTFSMECSSSPKSVRYLFWEWSSSPKSVRCLFCACSVLCGIPHDLANSPLGSTVILKTRRGAVISEDQIIEKFAGLTTSRDFVALARRRGVPETCLTHRYSGKIRNPCHTCMFKYRSFGILAKRSLERCWKIVSYVDNVVDLFRLAMSLEQLELPRDNRRKTMVERRTYASGKYKGYVYCDGIEEATELKKRVDEALLRDVGPSTRSELKLMCSEMEKDQGSDYSKWRYDPAWEELEHLVDRGLEDVKPEPPLLDRDGPLASIVLAQGWMRYASMNGDTSYLRLTGVEDSRA